MANASVASCSFDTFNVTEGCGALAFLDNLCLDALDVSDGRASFLGVLFEFVLLMYSFYAVATVADAHLVVALETLCVRWNVREDVAGASFMAFGSAAPEIIINAISTLRAVVSTEDGDSDDAALGVGAIIGSGMIAFTVIPGCCGLVTSRALALKRRPLARDVLAYALALALLYSCLQAGTVTALHAASMLALYAAYLATIVCAGRVRELYRVKHLGRSPRLKVPRQP